MRRNTGYVVIALVLGAMAALLVSVEAASAYDRKTGFLIPNQCKPVEGTTKPEGPYDDWPAPHTTACALQDACIKSGYGIWAENKFFRFDRKGQQMALEYFKSTKRTSYHKVEITGEFGESEVSVKKIESVD